jgi:type II secretory pathway component PulM
MWTANIPCQKFHTTSRLGRLFKVSEIAKAQDAQPSPDADVSQTIQTSLTQASTQLEELEKRKNNTIKLDASIRFCQVVEPSRMDTALERNKARLVVRDGKKTHA